MAPLNQATLIRVWIKSRTQIWDINVLSWNIRKRGVEQERVLAPAMEKAKSGQLSRKLGFTTEIFGIWLFKTAFCLSIWNWKIILLCYCTWLLTERRHVYPTWHDVVRLRNFTSLTKVHLKTWREISVQKVGQNTSKLFLYKEQQKWMWSHCDPCVGEGFPPNRPALFPTWANGSFALGCGAYPYQMI